jgi:hypothetical protein
MVTAQERQIIRELGGCYVLFGFAAWGGGMAATTTGIDWGSVPQWITAVVAVFAVVVAATGIAVQWRLARKRAAIDFFLKTEADKYLLEAYDEFWNGIRLMNAMKIEDFCTSEDKAVRNSYFAVRRYLNVHELIAVGIHNGMFDTRTCFDFWSGVLFQCVEAAKPVLSHVTSRPEREGTYIELETLYLK